MWFVKRCMETLSLSQMEQAAARSPQALVWRNDDNGMLWFKAKHKTMNKVEPSIQGMYVHYKQLLRIQICVLQCDKSWTSWNVTHGLRKERRCPTNETWKLLCYLQRYKKRILGSVRKEKHDNTRLCRVIKRHLTRKESTPTCLCDKRCRWKGLFDVMRNANMFLWLIIKADGATYTVFQSIFLLMYILCIDDWCNCMCRFMKK